MPQFPINFLRPGDIHMRIAPFECWRIRRVDFLFFCLGISWPNMIGEYHKFPGGLETAPIVTPTIDQHGFFGSKNVVAAVVKRAFFLTWSFFNQPCVSENWSPILTSICLAPQREAFFSRTSCDAQKSAKALPRANDVDTSPPQPQHPKTNEYDYVRGKQAACINLPFAYILLGNIIFFFASGII